MVTECKCRRCGWDGQGYFIPVLEKSFNLEKVDIEIMEEKNVYLCPICIFKEGASLE